MKQNWIDVYLGKFNWYRKLIGGININSQKILNN